MSFALVVVDVSLGLEEYVKSQDRGYEVDFGTSWHRVNGELYPAISPPRYPRRRSVRPGIDAIVDAVRKAREHELTVLAAEFRQERSEGQHVLCHWLQPYIPKANRYEKTSSSCFQSGTLQARLEADGVKRLLLIGYDRDICVFQTAQDAVDLGYEVFTSESCMLTHTQDHQDMWTQPSQAFFREKTTHLEEQYDVWNFLRNQAGR